MSDQQKNFLGIPVTGRINPGSTRVDQRPIEELQPIMQAVLDDPTIIEFGWTQFTPYFNDGEPCEFGVSGFWVRTDADADVDDTYELETDYQHPSLGKAGRRWDEEARTFVDLPYEGPDEARYRRCDALDTAIEGGAFENVLHAAFGDHAQITVRRDGIQVDAYSHN
ncbi:hypothetical protein ACU686_40405 [Yinghuangia aomiensis]